MELREDLSLLGFLSGGWSLLRMLLVLEEKKQASIHVTLKICIQSYIPLEFCRRHVEEKKKLLLFNSFRVFFKDIIMHTF